MVAGRGGSEDDSEIELQNELAQTSLILPNGAHLYTALVHFHRSSAQRNKSQSRAQLYGDRSSSRVNWFGIGAEQMSCAYFGGSLSARDMLVRHTLFGYYSLGLNEVRASKWASSLALGHAERSTRHIRNAAGTIVSGDLRWCPVCAQEDVDTHGFSAWKVVHQLPFMLQCPTHGCPLQSRCASCHQPLDNGLTMRLPGESCVRCGTSNFLSHGLPKGAGYGELIQRCARAVEDQDAIYRPANWKRLIRAVHTRVGSFEEAMHLIEKRLVREWGVNGIEDIGGEWLDGYRSDFLVQVMHGHLTASPLVIQMLVLEAIEGQLPGIRKQAESTTAMQAGDSNAECSDLSSESKREYVRHAQQLGADERFAALTSEP